MVSLLRFYHFDDDYGRRMEAGKEMKITNSFHELFNFSFREFRTESSQPGFEFFVSDSATLISIHIRKHGFKTFDFFF